MKLCTIDYVHETNT